MIRYRCPHCAALIVAHERRAGQSSVCKVCVKPHAIPADSVLWLNDRGDPLPAAPAEPAAAPAPLPAASDPIPVPAPVVSAEPPLEPEPPAVVFAPAPEPEPLPPAVVARAASVAELELPDLPEPPRVEPASVIVSRREPDPVAVREPEPEPSAPAVAVAERAADTTPPPTPAVVTISPPSAPRPSPPAPRAAGRFVPAVVSVPAAPRAEPVQLQTQADIAAALTAALTSRMKPAEAPRRDLRPSTAAWMLLTAIGVTLTALALFTDAWYRWPLLAVGVVQAVIGYVWIVRLTRFRDPARGVLCAIPPLTIYYLGQYKYAKLRPLRFVLTGAALIALAGATPALIPHTRKLVGGDAVAPPPDPATQSKLAQLRAARDQRSYESLARQLEVLARTDPLLSADAKDRAELSAELKALCDHPDTNVKVQAIAAYATWDPAGAKGVCLAAVRSPSADVRAVALQLLPRWQDAESARAVQSLISRQATTESNRAKEALEKIGGAAAEQAGLALLHRAEDQTMKLTALSVLEKVGGLETAGWLRSSYAAAADDPAVRDRALATSDAIKARVRAPAPKADPKS